MSDEAPAGQRLGADRAVWLAGAVLGLVAAVAWVGVLRQAAAMDEPVAPSGPAAAVGFVAAWAVMMAAMMLPSATPMIALYGAIHRSRGATGQVSAPTALFALTYLIVWAAVGVPVYLAGLAVSATIGWAGGMVLPYGVAAVLLAAGVYQLTPLKAVCLRACRSPIGFLMGHWRAGYTGTLRLGLSHAVYCVGCCWALMAVLVAAGAMGLPWVVLIALAVFAEKLLPRGEATARAIGLGLIVLGVAVAGRPELATALRGPGM